MLQSNVFSAGYIMDKFPGQLCLIMFLFTFFYGLLMALVPYAGNIYLFFILYFIIGFGSAGVDTGKAKKSLNLHFLEKMPFYRGKHFVFARLERSGRRSLHAQYSLQLCCW